MEKRIYLPLTEEQTVNLKAGDNVLLNGIIYTARDAAHGRLVKLIEEKEKLPIELKDAVIYYVGPTPEKPGQVIGSAGPTTSYRMDDLTVPLLERGLKVMIGKGKRSEEVINSMIKNKAVYLAAIGGAGAYISNTIKKCEVIAYEDLGPEAVRKLEVEDLQLIVAIDCYGNNIYEKGRAMFEKALK